MADFAELAAEGINHLTEKYFDQGYDRATRLVNGKPVPANNPPTNTGSRPQPQRSADPSPPRTAAASRAAPSAAPSSRRSTRRKHRNSLPSPERDGPGRPLSSSTFPARVRDLSEDRTSETSCSVLRAYERETDDPSRSPESVFSRKPPARRSDRRDRNRRRRDSAAMTSYNDGYEQSTYTRPRSQPPRSRYDDGNDSDYDERSGRRYRAGTGRGYDDDREDDRDYTRYVETTERYRGPPANRPWDGERQDSYRSNNNAGAVTQYGGGAGRASSAYSGRRSKSRGRGDRDRDRSYSRSRSRSRSHEGVRGKLDETFDTSGRGLGVGLAGAVIGGLAGRELGGHRTQKRDMIIGAIVGGLGANAAENKYRDWKDKERDRLERDENRWEQRWDGRSRSSMR